MARIIDVRTIALALICVPGPAVAHVEGKAMLPSIKAIDRIVDEIGLAGHLDRTMVETALRVSLEKTAETNVYETYEAKNVSIADMSADLELRAPIAGSAATGGTILVMHIRRGCPGRAEIEARYKPWTIANVPHGRSLDEETAWERKEPWGSVGFGFAERAPDCLSSVVFQDKGAGSAHD